MALVQQPPTALSLPTSRHIISGQVGQSATPDGGPPRNALDTTSIAKNIDINADRLVSSPYPDVRNQLILQDLELPYRLFAFALTILQSTRVAYATEPWLEVFNWSEVFSLLRALCNRAGVRWQRTEFYVVIFRSKLKEVIDRDQLGLLDQRSHEEACASGGLLKYWFGSLSPERRNLATCLWRNREDAIAGGAGPWHKQARLAAREMYERIDFHVHTFIVEDGARNWNLENYA